MKTPRVQQTVEQYDASAPRYETRWARYLEGTLTRALAVIDGPPSMVLLDVSCGTGRLLQALAQRFSHARLIGIDASPGMLRQVTAKHLPPNVQIAQGDAQALPLSSATCDWVVSTSALHHFHQPGKVLEECQRTLRPSGRLLILDWCREAWYCRLIDWWLRLVDRAHVRMYTRRELHTLLSQSGFVPQRSERFRVSWVFGLKLWDMMLVTASPHPPSHRGAVIVSV